jgi:hypothetical protein
MSNAETYEYDIAISYAGEDRSYAEALANVLRTRGVHVFYDKYEKAILWGQDLLYCPHYVTRTHMLRTKDASTPARSQIARWFY